MSQHDGVFRIKRTHVYLIWFSLLLLVPTTLVFPYKIATHEQPYPDLNVLLICYAIAGLLWLVILIEFGQKTARIDLNETDFTIRKFGQQASRHPYSAIQNINERPGSSKIGSLHELTVYLADNWFVIRSTEFDEYDYLRDQFTQYGELVPRRNVLTLIERNRLRWAIAGASLLVMAAIAFSFLAHNPIDKTPARLVSITDMATQTRENKTKSRLTGVTISLRRYPDLSFFVSRKNYRIRLDGLRSAIALRQPITLLIRESDLRKKLLKTEPLTFGDKYDNYKQIPVFGVEQGSSVRLQTPETIYEPTHTNPLQRTFLLSILLLFCWTGWAYVDRQHVLRAS